MPIDVWRQIQCFLCLILPRDFCVWLMSKIRNNYSGQDFHRPPSGDRTTEIEALPAGTLVAHPSQETPQGECDVTDIAVAATPGEGPPENHEFHIELQYPQKCVSHAPTTRGECCVVPYFRLGDYMSLGLVSCIMPRGDGTIMVTHEGCMLLHEFVESLYGTTRLVVAKAYEGVTQMVVGMGDLAKRQWIMLLTVALCKANGKHENDMAKDRQLQEEIGILLDLSRRYKTPTEVRNDAEIARALAEVEEANARYAAAHKLVVDATTSCEADMARTRREREAADVELKLRLEKMHDGFFVMLGKRLFRSG
ncbi:MAG: hypothetical protein LBB26_03010 [Puniceicoccales bacterium]|nr:hypothetical protein [Puniceicoccales bacterium]